MSLVLADRLVIRDRHAEATWAISETTPALEDLRSTSPTPSANQTATSAKNSSRISRHFQGWRMGVTLGAITTGVVLVINLSALIWAAAGAGLRGGLQTLQHGSCKETRNLNLWLHLAINALSTLLLGASNYTMQCLSSPTREEINTAHGKRQWLDIGIPSLRNLKHIARGRLLLWCLMALSSVPLHLLYNSVVFSTLSAQEYYVFAASAGMVNGTSLNWTLFADLEAIQPYQDTHAGLIDTVQGLKNATEWQKLDNRDCIKAYGQDFVSDHGDLVLIMPTINATGTLFPVTEVQSGFYGNYDWMCDQPECSTDAILSEATNWTLSSGYGLLRTSNGFREQFNHPIQYCLSQPVEERCHVQISLIILGVVVACNATKVLCMLLAIRRQKSQPLVTLGDAIESFMQDLDQNTDGMCLASKASFANVRKEKVLRSTYDRICHVLLESKYKPAWAAKSTELTARRYRWFSSASLKRWLTCNILWVF